MPNISVILVWNIVSVGPFPAGGLSQDSRFPPRVPQAFGLDDGAPAPLRLPASRDRLR